MTLYEKEKRQQNNEKWRARINNWHESGLSGSAWCRQHDIKYSQFVYWKDRLSEDQVLDPDSFIEITDQQTSTGIEIILEEMTIRLSKNFDFSTLQRCLQLLRSL